MAILPTLSLDEILKRMPNANLPQLHSSSFVRVMHSRRSKLPFYNHTRVSELGSTSSAQQPAIAFSTSDASLSRVCFDPLSPSMGKLSSIEEPWCALWSSSRAYMTQ